MSFSLTTPQFRARTKKVTRRLGWKDAKPGDRVMAVEKGMGLAKGEKVKRLGVIEFTNVVREPLNLIGGYDDLETAREGFPDMTADEFVRMFCRHMGCRPSTTVTRIEFKYL